MALNFKKVANQEDSFASLAAKVKVRPTARPPIHIKTDVKPTKGSKPPVSIQMLDEEQAKIANYMLRGVSFCCIGAAGTGKTTAVVASLMRVYTRLPALYSANLGKYDDMGCVYPHKHIKDHIPGMLVVSFTNKAVHNIARQMPTDVSYSHAIWDEDAGKMEMVHTSVNMRRNTCTVHKALEYAPNKVQKIDPLTKELVESVVFEPRRTAYNQLPPELGLIIIEESATVGLFSLLPQLLAAAPNAVFVFLGDLNQLQPVGDRPALGAALARLPVVELKKIYRYGGAIMDFAHRIRKGETTYVPFKPEGHKIIEGGSAVVLYTYPDDNILAPEATSMALNMLCGFWDKGLYVPGVDMALMPQYPSGDSSFGIQDVSEGLYAYMDNKLNRSPYYIRTGQGPQLLAVGDVVYSEDTKHEYLVLRIDQSAKYKGIIYPPRNYGTRDHHAWLDIHHAKHHDLESMLSLGDKAVEDEVASLQASFADLGNFTQNFRASAAVAKEDKVGRSATHEVMLLDLEFLPTALLEAGYEVNGDEAQEEFLRRISYVAMTLEADKVAGTSVLSQTEALELFKQVAQDFDIGQYFSENVISSSGGSVLKGLVYALVTVHKAQGSQARRVFFLGHRSNAGVSREMLYTACTRPRKVLVCIMPGTFMGPNPNIPANRQSSVGVYSQRIDGVTLEEKIESFESSLREYSARTDPTNPTKLLEYVDTLFLPLMIRNKERLAGSESFDYKELANF